jgi:hypothetical protein
VSQSQPSNPQQQADATAERVAALVALLQAGQIPDRDSPPVLAAAVYRGKVLASRAADILVSTLANRPPLGIVPGAQHLDRLAEAARTVLTEEDPEQAAERLERLAEAETLISAQMTTRSAIAGQGFTRYREHVAADACDVCQPFAEQIHDAEDEWTPHHPRCRCELVPEHDTQEEAT